MHVYYHWFTYLQNWNKIARVINSFRCTIGPTVNHCNGKAITIFLSTTSRSSSSFQNGIFSFSDFRLLCGRRGIGHSTANSNATDNITTHRLSSKGKSKAVFLETLFYVFFYHINYGRICNNHKKSWKA